MALNYIPLLSTDVANILKVRGSSHSFGHWCTTRSHEEKKSCLVLPHLPSICQGCSVTSRTGANPSVGWLPFFLLTDLRKQKRHPKYPAVTQEVLAARAEDPPPKANYVYSLWRKGGSLDGSTFYVRCDLWLHLAYTDLNFPSLVWKIMDFSHVAFAEEYFAKMPSVNTHPDWTVKNCSNFLSLCSIFLSSCLLLHQIKKLQDTAFLSSSSSSRHIFSFSW